MLTREWLRLTKNAFQDGCLINEYVTIRESGPMLTNNLTKVPKNKLDRLTLFHLLQSRVIQCKLNMNFLISFNYLLIVMNPETYNNWCDSIAMEPFSAKVMMQEVFSKSYHFCECRGRGVFVAINQVNHCLNCCRRLCTLDAHNFQQDFEMALVSWLAAIWKGKNIFAAKTYNSYN